MKHGTRSCYVKGCRCKDCSIANSTYVYAQIKKRKGKTIPDFVQHGKASTYINWYCRCKECTKAKYLQNKYYKERAK